MGAVYRARDEQTGDTVAVKVLTREGSSYLERFARETALLAELSHPNIVRYVTHGTAGDLPYLVMEWIEGETLSHRMTHDGLALREVVMMGRRAASALAAAHARGVVHRDIKPNNLIFPAGGDAAGVKLLDFGIARRQAAVETLTRTGSLIGTPGYMSPEQARADKPVDARADVWALGCVLYECVTGREAFAGEHVLALHAKILLSEPDPVRELEPDVPEALADLLARMLAKDPAGRPPGGAAVEAELAALGEVPAGPRRKKQQVGRDAPMAPEPARPASSTVSVVLMASPDHDGSIADTLAQFTSQAHEARLRQAATPQGAELELLADGSAVATVWGPRPVECAARAARCALALRALCPGRAIVVSCGRRELPPRQSLADALERGARALGADALDAIFAMVTETKAGSAIRLDDVGASLLGGEFVLEHGAAGTYLRSERGKA
jgi:hypothetical protein